MRSQLMHPSWLRAWVIGDVMLDRDWLGVVERVAPEGLGERLPEGMGELPASELRVESTGERLGGAAHVAHALVALGAAVALGGAVGDDEAGAALLARAT